MIKEVLVNKLPVACAVCDLFRYCEWNPVGCGAWSVDAERPPVGICFAKRIYFGPEDKDWIRKRRPTWCPMKEVPDGNA